jgi:hypothetical protein
MPAHGGSRPGAGRKHRDNVRLMCTVAPEVLEALAQREAKTGLYRTQIVSAILTESLIGGIVQR